MPPGGSMTPLVEALARVVGDAVALAGVEVVALEGALGRVLTADLVAQADVPPWCNSAMDGYAVRAADTWAVPAFLRVDQRIAAGGVGGDVLAGAAARIFTGAPLPPGADAVIMQEDVQLEPGGVRCQVAVRAGENVRARGQDIAAGAMVLSAGRRLLPQDLGVAASLGVAELAVRRRLRVGVLSTGDELQEAGTPLGAGCIYNSNRPMLIGLLRALGADCRDYGIIRDCSDVTRQALATAASECDLVISSGGVSVGEEDHVRAAVAQLGELRLWKLAIKPGKPLAYGRVGGTPFFGLPGNPAAVFVTFGLVVKPYIYALMGITEAPHRRLCARARFDWQHAGSRQEYLRATLCVDADGHLAVDVHENQSSGVLSLVSRADCLVEMPVGQRCRAGDWVTVLLIRDWVY